jgi:hypothetical protein
MFPANAKRLEVMNRRHTTAAPLWKKTNRPYAGRPRSLDLVGLRKAKAL